MKEMICIVCPKGCRLLVNDAMEVSGNTCPRGAEYAITELTAPTRVLTTTVRLRGGLHARLPVKTSRPIPKEKLMDAMEIIGQLEVNAPVALGTVVLENLLNTGIDLLACKNAALEEHHG